GRAVTGKRAGERGADARQQVRARRRAVGLTQRELAGLASVSVATVRDLEQGRTSRPRAQLVTRLVAILGLDAPAMVQLASRTASVDERTAPTGRVGPGAAGDRLRLRILGPMTAWRDGVPVGLGEPRQRAVLGLLALNAGTSVHRDTLVDAIWGQEPPAAAINLVQAHVGGLRRVLDPNRSPRDSRGVLVSTGTSYRLQMNANQLDWLAFRELVDRAATASAAADDRTACDLYDQALGLWHGEPLTDVDVLRDHPQGAVLHGAWAAAVAEYGESAATAGLVERVLPFLWRWTEGEPFNEKAHALLMLALAAVGEQAAALGVFADIRNR